MPEPHQVLKDIFGFDSFRSRQQEIIEHVMQGGDGLVLMPTGGGKSLCYQIPALCLPGTTVVISPLISLMKDQVQALRQLNVKAAALNSTVPYSEARNIWRAMRAGEMDLVYVAPERLLSDNFLSLMDQCRLALFAIDEAHCVSQWGHDFRPEYMNLGVLKQRYPDTPRLALTATADAPTRKDIAENLIGAEGKVFITGFDRPNIRLLVGPKDHPRRQLHKFLSERHWGESGIVYCMSRAKVESTAQWLAGQGADALPYHAGLGKAVRSANQDRFIHEEGVIIVATIAFGMGIDKPDVRFVAHLDLPKSLEAYYQEIGRGGRDGLPSDAWMVYGLEDVVKQRMFIDQSEAPQRQKFVESQKLEALLGFCETTRCRRQVMLKYFGDQCEPCGNCDVCLEPPQCFQATEAAQKALSAVYRTGQVFGSAHVISVLLGDDNQRIQRYQHQELSTYGIGREFKRGQWRSIFRQLVAMGLLIVDSTGHGGLKLGPQSRAVLLGEQEVSLRQEAVKSKGRKKTAKKAGFKKTKTPFDNPEDKALFQALREKRLELAKEQDIPPYMIFHDSTLIAMVGNRPQVLHEMARISGVGQAKLDRYGEDFLEVVKSS